MDWETYENITRNIYEALGKQSGVKIEGHGNTCRVTGKSGVSHQIDVLTSHSDGLHIYKTAIECKYWNKTINKDIVMKVAEIVEDASLQKGVIVSKSGFTEDATTFAAHKNIGLVELREVTEEDIKDEPRIVSHKTTIIRPEILNVIIIPSLFNKSEFEKEEMETENILITKHDGSEVSIKKIYSDFQQELKKGEKNKIVEKTIVMPMAKFINQKNKKTLYIDGITLRGRLIEFDSGLKWYPVDEVWLIMKSIFEKKSFTISKRGIIKEK